MITILITKEQSKVEEAPVNALNQQGCLILNRDSQDAAENADKKASGGEPVLSKGGIIGLGESLIKEKKGILYKTVLEAVERPLFEHVLEHTEGNQLKAARILGINRNTMRSKMKKFGINISKWKI